MNELNFQGILIGLATFTAIGIFHPLVIQAEYHFGRRAWWAFLAGGIACLTASLAVAQTEASIILGVVGFSSLWGIHEIFQQHERVRKGWFPMNPKRKADYEK